jgi:hypothetical protein
MSPVEQVRRFWSLFQARRWADAQALLSGQACCLWPVTRERFDGPGAIIHVNAIYPEGWSLHVLALNALADGRVHSLVRVDHHQDGFYANSFFGFDAAGLILQIEEFWSDVREPPAWRTDPALPLPGHTRLPVDDRRGLELLP